MRYCIFFASFLFVVVVTEAVMLFFIELCPLLAFVTLFSVAPLNKTFYMEGRNVLLLWLQALPSTSLWAPNIPVYALLTSTGEPLPSTSQIQVVGPLQIQVSS